MTSRSSLINQINHLSLFPFLLMLLIVLLVYCLKNVNGINPQNYHSITTHAHPKSEELIV